jgi:hypothetical protein
MWEEDSQLVRGVGDVEMRSKVTESDNGVHTGLYTAGVAYRRLEPDVGYGEERRRGHAQASPLVRCQCKATATSLPQLSKSWRDAPFCVI